MNDPESVCSVDCCGHVKHQHEFGNGRCRGWALGMPCECAKFQEPKPAAIAEGRSLVEQYTVKE